MTTTEAGKPTVGAGKSGLAATPLKPYFEACVKYEASDMLLRGGMPPRLRLRGTLKGLAGEPFSAEDFESWIHDSLAPIQVERLRDTGAVDMALDLDGSNRFRINIFRSRGRLALAARRVNDTIGSLEELLLPESISKIAGLTQGLVLIAGVTGSGKSTTIASILQEIIHTRPCHVVTIEDPIEYMFKDDKAVVHQREVGIDVPNFDEGLRALMRENPDVVLIGEMRDRETFEAALRAAETGHLVFGTIHASSTTQAFARIYDLFPQQEREAIRNLLAYQIQAIIGQRLIPCMREDLQRVPTVEILLQSPPVRTRILEGREDEITQVIEDSRGAGMQTFTDSLYDLVQRELVTQKDAIAFGPDPDRLRRRLKGINS